MVEALGAAVVQNPEAFANAAKTFVEAQGVAIDNVDKAIGVLTHARGFISTTITGHAAIVNLTSKSGTWYTYNDIAPIKWTT